MDSSLIPFSGKRSRESFEEETNGISVQLAILKDLMEREERIFNMEKKLSSSTSIETKLGKNQVVKLNVGGKIFTTIMSTLLSVNDTYFTGYFNDHFNPIPEKEDDAFFIDRPHEMFHLILNYLRGIDIQQKINQLDDDEMNDFIEEIVYYQLTPIYNLLPISGRKILKSKLPHLELEPVTEFNEEECSENIKIISPTQVRKIGENGWNAVVLGSETTCFKVRLLYKCQQLMIGFAPDIINLNSRNKNCGYFLHVHSGQLYSKENNFASYIKTPIANGSIIGCKLTDGKISYSVNGKDCGIAFSNIPQTPKLFPTFELFSNGCTLEFI